MKLVKDIIHKVLTDTYIKGNINNHWKFIQIDTNSSMISSQLRWIK